MKYKRQSDIGTPSVSTTATTTTRTRPTPFMPTSDSPAQRAITAAKTVLEIYMRRGSTLSQPDSTISRRATSLENGVHVQFGLTFVELAFGIVLGRLVPYWTPCFNSWLRMALLSTESMNVIGHLAGFGGTPSISAKSAFLECLGCICRVEWSYGMRYMEHVFSQLAFEVINTAVDGLPIPYVLPCLDFVAFNPNLKAVFFSLFFFSFSRATLKLKRRNSTPKQQCTHNGKKSKGKKRQPPPHDKVCHRTTVSQ